MSSTQFSTTQLNQLLAGTGVILSIRKDKKPQRKHPFHYILSMGVLLRASLLLAFWGYLLYAYL
jgi:hypothetical protein